MASKKHHSHIFSDSGNFSGGSEIFQIRSCEATKMH